MTNQTIIRKLNFICVITMTLRNVRSKNGCALQGASKGLLKYNALNNLSASAIYGPRIEIKWVACSDMSL